MTTITVSMLEKYGMDNGVITEDLRNDDLLVTQMLAEPDNIPYLFKKQVGEVRNWPFELAYLGPDFECGEDREVVIPKNKIVVSMFNQGLLRLISHVRGLTSKEDDVTSRIIFDPCGFGYKPIGDPPHESSRVFSAVVLSSAKRELGLSFTLHRGGCGDTPTYKAAYFDNTVDVLNTMSHAMNSFVPSTLPEHFLPFRLHKK